MQRLTNIFVLMTSIAGVAEAGSNRQLLKIHGSQDRPMIATCHAWTSNGHKANRRPHESVF
jgi:hypothetical protein